MTTEMAANSAPSKDKYRWIGPAYDALSAVYAGKSIYRAKIAMLGPEYLMPGDRILFAGVGHGADAIHAAEQGAEVTVVDLSATMLRKFQESLEKQGKTHLNIRSVHLDIFKFEEFEQFDMVVGNFFLNVFPEDFMQEVLAHLIRLAKPGGKVVVGDFARPKGNIFARMFKQAYWYVAVTIFWAIANNAMHRIYDYPAHMQRQGLKLADKRYYTFLGMDVYWSILGIKPTGKND